MSSDCYIYNPRIGLLMSRGREFAGYLHQSEPRLRQLADDAARLLRLKRASYGHTDFSVFQPAMVAALAMRRLDPTAMKPVSRMTREQAGDFFKSAPSRQTPLDHVRQGIIASAVALDHDGRNPADYAEHIVRALLAAQKAGFNPEQLRVPAGNPDGGQWTDGGGMDVPALDRPGVTGGKKPKYPEHVGDPGAVRARLKDGQYVTYKGRNVVELSGRELLTGTALLMPKDVSLQDNARMGEALRWLPSIIGSNNHVDLTTALLNGVKSREEAMVDLFYRYRSMDYQRTHTDTGEFKEKYRDFGNYNYGLVSAAAGYSRSQAIAVAGAYNLLKGGKDRSDAWFNNPRNLGWIKQGFDDYMNGLIK